MKLLSFLFASIILIAFFIIFFLDYINPLSILIDKRG